MAPLTLATEGKLSQTSPDTVSKQEAPSSHSFLLALPGFEDLQGGSRRTLVWQHLDSSPAPKPVESQVLQPQATTAITTSFPKLGARPDREPPNLNGRRRGFPAEVGGAMCGRGSGWVGPSACSLTPSSCWSLGRFSYSYS